MEEVAVIKFDMLNAAKPPHKIKMPVAATEFAVGQAMKTCSFLFFNQFFDFFIFNFSQLFFRDFVLCEFGTSFFNSGRT